MKSAVVSVVVALSFGLSAAPLGGAPPAGKTSARVGFLGYASPSIQSRALDAFRHGLRDLGWVEGQDLSIEYRWAEGDVDRLPVLAAELVRLNVNVIVTGGSAALRAVQQATTTIPIVSGALLVDPVTLGFAASFARPGGNFTGLASQYEEIVTKQVELLAEVVPKLRRLAILHHISVTPVPAKAAAAAAERRGLEAHILEVSRVTDFERAFGTARKQRAQAILVLPNPMFNAHRHAVIALAASHRLPALYEDSGFVKDGGLLSYGVSIPDMYRRAASYVDRILNGEKPGDLPIERPARFELVINLRTARALGVPIPQSLLQRVDQLIE